MSKIPIGNIKGPKGDPSTVPGPAGPAGPSTVPAADFIGSEIARPGSPAEQALFPKIGAVVPSTIARSAPDLIAAKSRPALARTAVPLVVFMDDDGRIPAWNTLRPLFAAQGIKASFAITTDLIGSSAAHMTWDQVRALRDEGHEIVNHSKTHASLIAANAALADAEIVQSLAKFRAEGIFPEGFAYAQSTSNPVARKVVRNTHRYGLGGIAGGGGTRTPIWSYAVGRNLINAATDIAVSKAQVDAYIANPGILVYFTHSTDIDTAKINELVDYIQAAGVEIVTAGEAIERYANIVDIGDRPGASANGDDPTAAFYVQDPFGTIVTNDPGTVVAPTGAQNSWALRTPQEFTAGKITIFSVTNSQTTLPTPSQPGTITVNAVVTSAWAYVTQEFIDNESRIFRRRATSATVWGGWRHVGGVRSATTAELSSAASAVNTLGKQSGCLVYCTDPAVAPARYLQAASGGATGAWREFGTATNVIVPS